MYICVCAFVSVTSVPCVCVCVHVQPVSCLLCTGQSVVGFTTTVCCQSCVHYYITETFMNLGLVAILYKCQSPIYL